MPTHHVDVHLVMHSCPANPESHVIDTSRKVVHTVDNGPCHKPIQVGQRWLPCGQVAPHERQCPPCKTHIIIRNTTITDLGHLPGAVHTHQPALFEVQAP